MEGEGDTEGEGVKERDTVPERLGRPFVAVPGKGDREEEMVAVKV